MASRSRSNAQPLAAPPHSRARTRESAARAGRGHENVEGPLRLVAEHARDRARREVALARGGRERRGLVLVAGKVAVRALAAANFADRSLGGADAVLLTGGARRRARGKAPAAQGKMIDRPPRRSIASRASRSLAVVGAGAVGCKVTWPSARGCQVTWPSASMGWGESGFPAIAGVRLEEAPIAAARQPGGAGRTRGRGVAAKDASWRARRPLQNPPCRCLRAPTRYCIRTCKYIYIYIHVWMYAVKHIMYTCKYTYMYV